MDARMLRRSHYKFVLALCLVMIPCVSRAQDFIEAPSATRERFLDKTNIMLLTSLTVWQGLDAYHTDRTISEGGREQWPVARYFCQSRGGRIGYFWSSYALTVGSSYLLHRRGHRKLSRAVLFYGSVSAASGVAYTLAQRR
jgi:hypothetical protein